MNNSVKTAAIAAGSQVALAKALNVSEVAISTWVKRGWVPPRHALTIERLFKIPRHTLLSPKLQELVVKRPVRAPRARAQGTHSVIPRPSVAAVPDGLLASKGTTWNAAAGV